MSLFLYIVRCSDGTNYTGVSNDPERRLEEHNNGISKKAYTFRRRPVELVFSEEFADPSEAIRAEKQVSDWSRKKKEALIQGYWDALRELAACKNETSSEHHKQNSRRICYDKTASRLRSK